jgi:heme-degrading monooxygenase HmoA
MIVVTSDQWIIPGRRPELVQAHADSGELLKSQPGFVSSRLLHFAGGPYRYLFEMTWETREDFERFWSSPTFAEYRADIDKWLSAPFNLSIYDVKWEA